MWAECGGVDVCTKQLVCVGVCGVGVELMMMYHAIS